MKTLSIRQSNSVDQPAAMMTVHERMSNCTKLLRKEDDPTFAALRFRQSKLNKT